MKHLGENRVRWLALDSVDLADVTPRRRLFSRPS